jgi:hypothetical protein
VIGTAVTNGGGNGSVGFTGSAVFSSASSYRCPLTPEGTTALKDVPVVNTPTASGFAFKGTASTTYDFICVGN